MSDIILQVNGKQYGGWTSISVNRTMQSLCGAFRASMTDRWIGQDYPWEIRPQDAVTVLVDGEKVMTGWVDALNVGYDAKSRTLEVMGRDKAGDLVDSSAANSPDNWAGVKLEKLAQQIASPFGVGVNTYVDTGEKIRLAKIQPGESAWEFLERHMRMQGVIATCEPDGSIAITKAGSKRAVVALVEGENILRASGLIDLTGRYNKYTVKGQGFSLDDITTEQAAHVQATALDHGVMRHRPLIIVAETNATTASAKKRAAWEAAVRAGRSGRVGVAVQGWRQKPGGPLWDVNMLVAVRSPLLNLPQSGDLLIHNVTYSIDEQGTITTMELVNPAAYEPQPDIEEKKQGQDNPWGALLNE